MTETLQEMAARMWRAGCATDEAEQLAKRIVQIDPRHPRARAIQAAYAWKRGDEALGLELIRRAVSCDPDDLALVRQLGRQCLEAGLFEEGEATYRRAADLANHEGHAEMDVALAVLYAGRWREGWALYETAQRVMGRMPPFLVGPRWRGEDGIGTLLVLREGGYGDMIQGARFLPLLLERGVERVIYKVPKALHRLFDASFAGYGGRIQIDAGPWEVAPRRFNRWCRLMALPHLLDLGDDLLPAPYLRPTETEPRVTGLVPKIGLTWGGSPLNPRDHMRCLSLDALRLLLATPGVEWHALQQGPHLNDLGPELWRLPNVVVHDTPTDFDDTARVITGLDAVVSADTSVAHLAGALGAPLIVMAPATPDFRYPWRRADSPWYASARIVQPDRPGDWLSVVRKVQAIVSPTAQAVAA